MEIAIEFFSGIGGFTVAAPESVRTAVAIDINEFAAKTYATNFGTTPLMRSVESLTADYLAKQEATLWWLSPPCQPFTRRGRQRDDEDVRSAALLHLIECLPAAAPRLLALENVPGFNGSRTQARLLQRLENCGFHWQDGVLCPTQFGIPNRRQRYYLIATQDRKPRPLTVPPPKMGRPLSDYLLPLSCKSPSARTSGSPSSGRTDWRSSRNFDDWLVPFAWQQAYSQAIDVVDPQAPQATASCFTAAYGRSPVRSGSYIQAGERLRFFHPSEVVALLGFPQDFRFPSGLTRRQAWRLAGNSLACHVVRFVLQRLLNL